MCTLLLPGSSGIIRATIWLLAYQVAEAFQTTTLPRQMVSLFSSIQSGKKWKKKEPTICIHTQYGWTFELRQKKKSRKMYIAQVSCSFFLLLDFNSKAWCVPARSGAMLKKTSRARRPRLPSSYKFGPCIRASSKCESPSWRKHDNNKKCQKHNNSVCT